jgi:hypothetical protein
MSSAAIGGIVFACVFAGALLGMFLHTALPKHHMSADTKDVVKVAIAVIATISALVVSLLISSAKSSYDSRCKALLQASADIVLTDHMLAHYGPESREARALLRQLVTTAIERGWPNNGARPAGIDPNASPAEALYDKIAELVPQTDSQRTLQVQALNKAIELGRMRLLLFAQLGSSIPLAFVAVLVFWLTLIFISFGLFAPRNATVTAIFFACSLSISGAVFLILELDRSPEGIIQIPSAPLRLALSLLGG